MGNPVGTSTARYVVHTTNLFSMMFLIVIKLRKLYRVVYAIQCVSGWTWDDKTGATIDVHTTSSWDDYLKVHPQAKPFRNRGWPYFGKMQELMPPTVTGANVYHAASAPPPSLSQPSTSSYNDSDDDTNPSIEERPDDPSDTDEVCS